VTGVERGQSEHARRERVAFFKWLTWGQSMEGSVNGKVRAVLLVLALLWASAWVLSDASWGNWVLTEVCCALTLVVSSTLSLIPILVAALIHVAIRVFRRRLCAADCLPVLVVVVGLLLGWKLPSKPAATFWLHRGEFLELAEWAVDECDASWREVTRPPASLFDHTRIECRPSGTVVIEFFSGNSYLSQLVFISSDRPEDTPPCSYELGHVDQKLQAQWYVCSIRAD